MRVFYIDQVDEVSEGIGSGILLVGAAWGVNVQFLELLEASNYTGIVFNETVPCDNEDTCRRWFNGVRRLARTRAYWIQRDDPATLFDFGTYVNSSTADSVVVGGPGAPDARVIKELAHVNLVVHDSVVDFATMALQSYRRSRGGA